MCWKVHFAILFHCWDFIAIINALICILLNSFTLINRHLLRINVFSCRFHFHLGEIVRSYEGKYYWVLIVNIIKYLQEKKSEFVQYYLNDALSKLDALLKSRDEGDGFILGENVCLFLYGILGNVASVIEKKIKIFVNIWVEFFLKCWFLRLLSDNTQQLRAVLFDYFERLSNWISRPNISIFYIFENFRTKNLQYKWVISESPSKMCTEYTIGSLPLCSNTR